MFNLDSIVRENVKTLTPYSSARDEFTGAGYVHLDANELPDGSLNRYPDPNQQELKSEIAKRNNVSPSNIFIGNGSDEVIDLLFRAFCEPNKDSAACFNPSYGMYRVSAAINNVTLLEIELDGGFQIDVNLTLKEIKRVKPNLVFICSPNNPTGNTISKDAIQSILQTTSGLVILDEAYIDFSAEGSWTSQLSSYENLVVLQTFSKSRGLAAARVGMAFASPAIISILNRIKPPYNVSELNQKAALDALIDPDFGKRIAEITSERDKLKESLERLDFIQKAFPSEGNFILVKVDDADSLYQYLLADKIVIRNRNAVIKNTVRITVGSVSENELLIDALKNYKP